ncbi:MAG: hypothetical protein HZA04_06105 [Nitrospinae bacterium]|nr:hypothetical protein [Nitrospinota bacterium]
MAVLFSMESPELFLDIPDNGQVNIQRKIVLVETLDGVQSRDLGHWPGGLKLTFTTELDDTTLAALASAVENGDPLGLSAGMHSYAVMAQKLESRKLHYGGNAVTLETVVVKQL